MSVSTGSFGTADVPASSPSLYGLDRVNFFLAAALAGFGPCVPAYLADQKWTLADIGLVLTMGSVAALLSQLPGGELLDKARFKRGSGVISVLPLSEPLSALHSWASSDILLSYQVIPLIVALLGLPLFFALAQTNAVDIHFGRSCGAPGHHGIAQPPRAVRSILFEGLRD